MVPQREEGLLGTITRGAQTVGAQADPREKRHQREAMREPGSRTSRGGPISTSLSVRLVVLSPVEPVDLGPMGGGDVMRLVSDGVGGALQFQLIPRRVDTVLHQRQHGHRAGAAADGA